MWIFFMFYLVTIACLPCNCAPNAPRKTVKALTEEFTAVINKARKEHFDWIEEYQLIFDANIGSLNALDEVRVKINDGEQICKKLKIETIPVESSDNLQYRLPQQSHIDMLQDFWESTRQETSEMIDILFYSGFGDKHTFIMEKMSQKNVLKDGERFQLLTEIRELREKTQMTFKIARETPTKFKITTYQTKLNGLETFRETFRKEFFNNKESLKKLANEVDAMWKKTFESPLTKMEQTANDIKKIHQEAIVLRGKLINVLNSMFEGAKFEAKDAVSNDHLFCDPTLDEKLNNAIINCKATHTDNKFANPILTFLQSIFITFLEIYDFNMQLEIERSGLYVLGKPIRYKLQNEPETSMPPVKFEQQKETITKSVENVQNFLYPFAYGDVEKELIRNFEVVLNGKIKMLNLNENTRKILENLFKDVRPIKTKFENAIANLRVGNLKSEFQKLKDKLKPAYDQEPSVICKKQNSLADEYLNTNIGPIYDELYESLSESRRLLDGCENAYQRFITTFERIFNAKTVALPVLSVIKVEKLPDPKIFDDLMQTRVKYYGENDPSRLVLNTLKASHDEDLKVLVQIGNNLTRIGASDAFKPIIPFAIHGLTGDFQYPDQGYLTMMNERRNDLIAAFNKLYNAYRMVCFNSNLDEFQQLVKTKLTAFGKCPPINLKNIDTIDRNVSNRNKQRNKIIGDLNAIFDIGKLENCYKAIQTKIAGYKKNQKTLKDDISEMETMITELIRVNDKTIVQFNKLSNFIRIAYDGVVKRHTKSISDDLSKAFQPLNQAPVKK